MSEARSRGHVAVVGFGSQGRAQAERLRAAGFDVTVGLRPRSRNRRRARRLGFRVASPGDAVRGRAIVALLVPDRVAARVLAGLAPVLKRHTLVVLAAGYPLVFPDAELPRDQDIVLVAPHGPGRDLPSGISGFVGVFQDASGRALGRARRYARALGLWPLFETTPMAEAHGDLFGEQALLCGGLTVLCAATADVMLRRGLPAANAYFETIAQLDRLSALLKERGIDGFWEEISDCAAFGMARAVHRLGRKPLRLELETLWEQIASGAFARDFRRRGRPRSLPPRLRSLRRLERAAKKRGGPGRPPAKKT